MSHVKTFLLSVVVLTSASCSHVGYFETSDPAQKIRNAHFLMQEGRYTAAKKLLNEALDTYTKNNDELGQVSAHAWLGEVNRDGKAPNLPDYPQAIVHFRAATAIYNKLKKPKMEAYILYATAGVQLLQGKNAEACVSLIKSKEIYAKAPQRDEVTDTFEKMGELSFNAYPYLLQKYKCQR